MQFCTVQVQANRFAHQEEVLWRGCAKTVTAKNAIKNAFSQSLIELTQKKPIEKITVKEIVSRSQMGRQTFYNHFKDKYDLINWTHEQSYNQILEIYNCFNTNGYDRIFEFFQLLRNNKLFYEKLAQFEGQNSFEKFLFEHTMSYHKNCILKVYGESEINNSLLFSIRFFTNGFVSMAIEWIKNGMKDSPEYMAESIMNNMPTRLKRYYIYFT